MQTKNTLKMTNWQAAIFAVSQFNCRNTAEIKSKTVKLWI